MGPWKSISSPQRRRVAGAFAVAFATVAAVVLAATATVDLEVKRSSWNAGARAFAVEATHSSGLPLSFNMTADAIQGLSFRVDLEGVAPGDVFSVHGLPNQQMKVQELTRFEPEAEWPSSESRPGGSPAFGELFKVVALDGASSVARAVSTQGTTIRFRVDPAAWQGYVFRVRPADLALGRGFTLVAVNDAPVRKCCTLLETL